MVSFGHVISFNQSEATSIAHFQVDPETLTSLAVHHSATGKGKVGGGLGRGGVTSKGPALPTDSSSGPSKPSSTGSEEDVCGTTLTAAKPTERSFIYISSDESDSDSSFPESNDSDDESSESMRPRVKVEVGEGGAQVPAVATPPAVGLLGSKVTSPTVTNPYSDKDGSKGELPQGWTGAEVTYFRLLHPIFGHNYCTIAELLRSKSCLEVFQYTQQAGSDLLQGGGTRRFNGKKKKKNMR